MDTLEAPADKLLLSVLKNYHKDYSEISVNKEQLKAITARSVNSTRKNIVAYKPLSNMIEPQFPILVTYGIGDVYGDSKTEVKNRYPSGEFQVIEDSGHIPWIHNPFRFGKILSDFYSLETSVTGNSTQ
ncbi:MAG: hypothetical protein ABJG41_16680 [Cyclobacteriaceae bacterium]